MPHEDKLSAHSDSLIITKLVSANRNSKHENINRRACNISSVDSDVIVHPVSSAFSVFFLLSTFHCMANVIMIIFWDLVVLVQIIFCMFSLTFNVLTFIIELPCRFVTLKAANTPIIVCNHKALLWRCSVSQIMYISYLQILSFLWISPLVVLDILWNCVPRTWETVFEGVEGWWGSGLKDPSVCLERIYVIISVEGGGAEWSACKLVVALLHWLLKGKVQ